MRTRAVGLLATLSIVAAIAAPAHADSVRVASGPGTSADGVFVSYVGCDAFFGPSAAPSARINLGPGAAPMGRRSLGLVPQGAGTASGPVVSFDSLASLDAGVSVHATGGTTGASWVWVITPDAPAGTAWSGRADARVPAGGWTRVDATALDYSWTLVDLATRRPVSEGGSATTKAFASEHGDGAGYVITGFGCGGEGFNIDAARGQGTTLDFEGLVLATTIAGPATAGAGDTVTITGSARDGERVMGDPLVLQARGPGGDWKAVGETRLSGADGLTRAEVQVQETTDYRWYRPQGEYADEGWSEILTVRVAAPQPVEKPAEQPSGNSGNQQAGEKPDTEPGQKADSKPEEKPGEKQGEAVVEAK